MTPTLHLWVVLAGMLLCIYGGILLYIEAWKVGLPLLALGIAVLAAQAWVTWD